MKKKHKYEVGNNTDLRDRPFCTNNRREAARVWREIRPDASAGNLYSAWFVQRCSVHPNEWTDARSPMGASCPACLAELTSTT